LEEKFAQAKGYMGIVKHLLAKAGLSERRWGVRMRAPGIEVSYWTGVEQEPVKLKDVSATGAYVITDERWLPGMSILLTLQTRGLRHRRIPAQIQLRAKSVRVCDDGVGVSFIPDHVDPAQWAHLAEKAFQIAPKEGIVGVLRCTTALAFILQISPSIESQVWALFTDHFSWERREKAIAAILRAKNLLADSGRPVRTDVPPELILGLLEYAANTDEHQMHHAWAGFLATASAEGASDDLIREFTIVLSQLSRAQFLILSAAGTKAMSTGWQPGFGFPRDLSCAAEEVRKITGIKDLVLLERELNQLLMLGLLEKTEKPLGCAQLERVNMAPTSLGLKFYAASSGPTEIPEVSIAALMQTVA
jgi:hypothetical protein